MSFLRLVFILLLAIVLISLLRGVIGIIAKAVAGLADPARPRPREASGSAKQDALKRDPVCGVYVPAATAVKRTVDGEVVHFCSEACSARYRG